MVSQLNEAKNETNQKLGHNLEFQFVTQTSKRRKVKSACGERRRASISSKGTM